MRSEGSRKEKKRKSSEIDRERWNRRADVEWDRSNDRVESNHRRDQRSRLLTVDSGRCEEPRDPREIIRPTDDTRGPTVAFLAASTATARRAGMIATCLRSTHRQRSSVNIPNLDSQRNSFES